MKVVKAPADLVQSHWMRGYEVEGEEGKWVDVAYEFEYPHHFGLWDWEKSMTLKFTQEDFEYVKKCGWGMKKEHHVLGIYSPFSGRKRHEPYEIRRDLLMKTI
jgi:hypothetical protein